MHNPEANIALDLEYTELPPFSLCTKDFVKSSQGSVCARVYVCLCVPRILSCVCLYISMTVK